MSKLKFPVKIELDVPLQGYLLAALILAASSALIVALLQNKLPPQVPLFYGAAESEAQLAPSWFLIFPSVISVIVVLTNSALASFLKDDFTKKVLVLSALVVTLFATITTFKIIFLVGSF